MIHTRKGYYTIEFEGLPLSREDGTLIQHQSLDECWETISNDVREGDFTVKCPDRVIGKKLELTA